MNENIHTLIPTKSDQEIATDIKKQLIEAYKPILAIADKAKEHGMIFQCSVGENAFGQFIMTQCQVLKAFK